MPTYFGYGYQPRYAFQWGAGQGGVMQSHPPGELGAADLLESGYSDPSYEPYPALQKYARCAARVQKPCGLRAKAAAQLAGLSDWPLVRPAGFEPEAMGFLPSLSNNEKTLALAAAGALALWWFTKRRKRRNPSRKNPWAVTSTTRGVTGRLVFRRKKDAVAYAAERREAKKPAKVAPYRLSRRRKRR